MREYVAKVIDCLPGVAKTTVIPIERSKSFISYDTWQGFADKILLPLTGRISGATPHRRFLSKPSSELPPAPEESSKPADVKPIPTNPVCV